MPPTSKKLKGPIGFRVVHPCIRSSKTVYARVLKLHISILHGKIFDARFFFFVRVISLSGVMPLWIKSQWNLMYATSYEPCRLGFWNFKMDFSWKNSWSIFFSFPSYLPFWSYAPLKKSEWHLVSEISSKLFELGGLKLGQLIRNDEQIMWLN